MPSTVKEPYWPAPLLLTDQVWVSLVSTSDTVNWPSMRVTPSSVTVPVLTPLIVGASLLPWMVIVTLVLLPSAVVTCTTSLMVSPLPSACTSALVLFSA